MTTERTRERDLRGFCEVIKFGDFTQHEINKIHLATLNYELAARGLPLQIRKTFRERLIEVFKKSEALE